MTPKSLMLAVSAYAALMTGPLAQADIPYSAESVQTGQQLFMLNCTSCHGNDGKATVNFVADATNLTTPDQWRGGNSKQHIFDAIKSGQAVDMPAFEWILNDEEEIWHLVNFVLSLWPDQAREQALTDFNAQP